MLYRRSSNKDFPNTQLSMRLVMVAAVIVVVVVAIKGNGT